METVKLFITFFYFSGCLEVRLIDGTFMNYFRLLSQSSLPSSVCVHLCYLACENSRPSSLPARVALHAKRRSGRERRRTAVFAG